MLIEGLDQYRSGMAPLQDFILQAGENGQSPYATADQTATYWQAFHSAGRAFARDILDTCIRDYGAADDVEAASLWGYDIEEGGEGADRDLPVQRVQVRCII